MPRAYRSQRDLQHHPHGGLVRPVGREEEVVLDGHERAAVLDQSVDGVEVFRTMNEEG
jgi:hypothetical protein